MTPFLPSGVTMLRILNADAGFRLAVLHGVFGALGFAIPEGDNVVADIDHLLVPYQGRGLTELFIVRFRYFACNLVFRSPLFADAIYTFRTARQEHHLILVYRM